MRYTDLFQQLIIITLVGFTGGSKPDAALSDQIAISQPSEVRPVYIPHLSLSSYLSVSICLSVCLSTYLSCIYVYLCVSIYPSIRLSICLSVYLSAFICLTIILYLSISQPESIFLYFYLPLSVYISESIYLSICQYLHIGCICIYIESSFTVHLSLRALSSEEKDGFSQCSGSGTFIEPRGSGSEDQTEVIVKDKLTFTSTRWNLSTTDTLSYVIKMALV